MQIGRQLRALADRLFGPRSKADEFTAKEPFYDRGLLPRTLYDYGRDVQGGLDSNVIMSPVMWIMRTFTEARAVVESKTDKVWKIVDEHDAEHLIDRPNLHYDGDALWKGAALSYTLDGNGYIRKVRNRFGDVLELWYVPHWLIKPKWPQDGSQFISHYEYTSGFGAPVPIATRDVIHFRFGLDPRNTRLGISPLRPLLREVFTDDEAANFSAQILKNMGVPGLLISPKSETLRPTPEDIDQVKAHTNGFQGDGRGGTLVMGVPTEVEQFGFDPNKLMLANLRDIAEERVCAALGLPAAVVGFGSGLQATKVGATMREMVRLAWVQCLTPMQKSMAKQLTAQLLPDFVTQTRRFRVRFDMSDVSAFQEEENQRAERATRLVQAGVLRVDRAQAMVGAEVDETQKIYLRPSNSVAYDEHGKPVKAPALPPPADGDDDDEEAERTPASAGGEPESQEDA